MDNLSRLLSQYLEAYAERILMSVGTKNKNDLNKSNANWTQSSSDMNILVVGFTLMSEHIPINKNDSR